MREKPAQELSEIELAQGKRSKKGILLHLHSSNDSNDPLVGALLSLPTTRRLTSGGHEFWAC